MKLKNIKKKLKSKQTKYLIYSFILSILYYVSILGIIYFIPLSFWEKWLLTIVLVICIISLLCSACAIQQNPVLCTGFNGPYSSVYTSYSLQKRMRLMQQKNINAVLERSRRL